MIEPEKLLRALIQSLGPPLDPPVYRKRLRELSEWITQHKASRSEKEMLAEIAALKQEVQSLKSDLELAKLTDNGKKRRISNE